MVMADSASLALTIDAPPEHVWALATDFASYPTWARDVKEAVVTSVDDDGRVTEVEYRASALGRSTHYTLAYDYDEAPRRLSWSMVKGDIMRAIDGSYDFSPDGHGGTDVRYDL